MNPGGVEVIVLVTAKKVPLEVGPSTPVKPGAAELGTVELGEAKPGSAGRTDELLVGGELGSEVVAVGSERIVEGYAGRTDELLEGGELGPEAAEGVSEGIVEGYAGRTDELLDEGELGSEAAAGVSEGIVEGYTGRTDEVLEGGELESEAAAGVSKVWPRSRAGRTCAFCVMAVETMVVKAKTLIAAVRPAKRGRVQSGTMVTRNLGSEDCDIISMECLINESRWKRMRYAKSAQELTDMIHLG